MPELTYTDAELGLSPGWDEHLDPNIRRELRDARIVATKLAAADAEIATLRRERVLTQAGIPADKRGEAFAKVYTEATDDPAKVKAAFEELFGPISPEGGNAGDGAAGAGDEGLTAEQRIAAAANGGTGTQGAQTGTVDLAEAIKNAKTNEEVKAIIKRASETATFAPGQMIPRLPEDQ